MGLVEVGVDWTMRVLELLRRNLAWMPVLFIFSSLLDFMHE